MQLRAILGTDRISVKRIIQISLIGYTDMRFTLRQLEVFVATARQESVSRAAEFLSMSQSAASTSITELERQFDCQLFDRIGKRLRLNALGHQLLAQAVALLDQAREVQNLLDGRSGFGSLNVGATLTVGNYLATLLIGRFMQRHPECRAALHVHNTVQIVQMVAHFELDLAVQVTLSGGNPTRGEWHPLDGFDPADLPGLMRKAWGLVPEA